MTILLVDDEKLDRSVASQILRTQGHHVLEAESYCHATAIFDVNREAVNMLIVDVSLPDGNGCSLAIAIKEQKPDLRVLFLSGHVGSEVCKYYGLKLPSVHFLKKPFTANDLVKRVRKILNGTKPFPRMKFPTTLTTSSNWA